MIEAGKLQAPELPKAVAKSVASLGKNVYGDPLYRVVWGQKRLDWIGGKWENEKSEAGILLPPWVGVKRAPRYFGPAAERWHLEEWRPAPCSKEDWEKHFTEYIDGVSVEMLGPYPSRGDYESVASIEHEYIHHPNIIKLILTLIDRHRSKTSAERQAERDKKKAEQEQKYAERDVEILLDNS